jgi:predicted Zn-dependent protease
MRLARAVLVVVALVVCAWFVLGIVQAQDTQRATALIAGGNRLSPAQARHARALLDSAGTLNPDLTIDLLRGQLAADQHQLAAAERIAQSVARREPLSLAAWSQLAYAAARRGDRTRLVVAARHISELYPKLR